MSNKRLNVTNIKISISHTSNPTLDDAKIRKRADNNTASRSPNKGKSEPRNGGWFNELGCTLHWLGVESRCTNESPAFFFFVCCLSLSVCCACVCVWVCVCVCVCGGCLSVCGLVVVGPQVSQKATATVLCFFMLGWVACCMRWARLGSTHFDHQ